jgi:hypothetical protein
MDRSPIGKANSDLTVQNIEVPENLHECIFFVFGTASLAQSV